MKDKWKSKSWYTIVAPDMFNGAKVGETPATEPEILLGRVTEVSMQELAGDFSKVHLKVKLKINAVRGGECLTRFVGHDMTSDYVRRLTRRRRSKIESVFDVRTKEGYKIRVKILSITNKRINSSIKRSLREKQYEVIKEMAKSSTLSQFVQKMISDGLAKKIKKECKPIYPLKTVEVNKSTVLSVPREEQVDELIISEEELEREKEEREEEIEEEEPVDKKVSKTDVLKLFQDIEGVGPTMAERLYDGGFRSVEDLTSASVQELKEVEGVGEAFSKRIYKALHPEE